MVLSLPLLFIILKLATVFSKTPLRNNYFKFEMLSIIIYFMWGALIGLIVDHNNSDLRAW